MRSIVHAPGQEKMSLNTFHDIVNAVRARVEVDLMDERWEMRRLREDVSRALGLIHVVYQRRVGIDGMDKPWNTGNSRTKSMDDGISYNCGRIAVEAIVESL
jgi:hypothetical protein